MDNVWEKLVDLSVQNQSQADVLLQEDPQALYARSPEGETALGFVAAGNYVEGVRFFVRKNADLSAANNRGETALMLAAQNGHSRVVRILLDAKADVKIKDEKGETALHKAARGGHGEIFRWLVGAGASTEEPNATGETASDLLDKQRNPAPNPESPAA